MKNLPLWKASLPATPSGGPIKPGAGGIGCREGQGLLIRKPQPLDRQRELLTPGRYW